MIFLSSCKFAEKEKYIFPASYNGNIYIFSNIKNGVPKQYDNGQSRIYTVPQSGILLSQFRETYGIIDKKFFFKTINGELTELAGIPFKDNKNALDDNKLYAFYGNDVTITFPKAKDTLGVQIITICTPKDFEIASQEPFMKVILGSHFSPEDVSYQKFIDMRRKADTRLLQQH
ncbi:hypothetical protein ABIB62_004765 [Mucilaginibacter sp. UYP25]